jgi:hypothetical protein
VSIHISLDRHVSRYVSSYATLFFFFFRRRLQEPKLLPQEEVTYAEPVLVTPSSKPMNTSPKATLRKQDNNLFTQFQNSESYYPSAPHPAARPRDHFGTLRSQRDFARVSVGHFTFSLSLLPSKFLILSTTKDDSYSRKEREVKMLETSLPKT